MCQCIQSRGKSFSKRIYNTVKLDVWKMTDEIKLIIDYKILNQWTNPCDDGVDKKQAIFEKGERERGKLFFPIEKICKEKNQHIKTAHIEKKKVVTPTIEMEIKDDKDQNDDGLNKQK